MYLLNWRNPEIRRGGVTTSLTLNSGGVIHDLEFDDTTSTNQNSSPITINTSQVVHLRNGRVRSTAQCFRDLNGGKSRSLILENMHLRNNIPPALNQLYGRIVDIYQPALLMVIKCDMQDHGGIKVTGNNTNGDCGTIIVNETRSTNILSVKGDGAGGYAKPSAGDTNNDNASGGWKQFVQINKVWQPAKCEIRWCESVGRWGESMPGDDYSVIDSTGTSINPIVIADCLSDGGYGLYQYSVPDANGSYRAFQSSPAGNRLNYSGTGFMIETGSSGSAWVQRLRCHVIAHTNGGIYTYGSSTNCLVDLCRAVSSGLAPDGTRLASATNPGLYSTNGPTSTTYSNTYSRWMSANPWTNPFQRGDINLGTGTTSTNNDAPGTGSGPAVTLADEAAERLLWLAKKRAAGIYPGSMWLASPGGY